MTSQATISVKFDRASLLKTMRFAFARRDTVVAELIQNSRRAGATRIDIDYDREKAQLRISDDGCGLGDFAKLIHFSVSGWDQETQSIEQPFGIGFLSAIYAGTAVTVESRGKRVEIESSAVLSGSRADVPFPVTPSEVCQGAVVTIHGFELDDAKICVGDIVQGFPVPVYYNGECVPRPYAMGPSAVACDVGNVIFLGEFPALVATGEPQVYLQGLRVQKAFMDPTVIVHLDSTQFRGKFPDRDSVVDQADMLKRVRDAIASVVVDDVRRAVKTMEPMAFCLQRYGQAASVNALDVFNDIPVIPASWLGEMTDLPRCKESWEQSPWWNADASDQGAVRREDIESGAICVATLNNPNPDEPDNMSRWNLAYACGLRVLRKILHEDHWIYLLAALSEEDEVQVEVIGADPDKSMLMRGHGYYTLQPCTKVVFSTATLSGEAKTCVHHDDVLLPVGARLTADVLRQAQDYFDEYGHFDENAFDADADLFLELAQQALVPDLGARLLVQLLKAVGGVESNAVGASFRVSLTANGWEVEPA